jgi:hypothetical protein
MWTVDTSLGQRVDRISHEHSARAAVHSMGITTLVAPYRYLVTDNHGQRFHAEIHRTLSPTGSREGRVGR